MMMLFHYPFRVARVSWVSIEPGYTVWAKNYPRELVIEYEGKIVSSS